MLLLPLHSLRGLDRCQERNSLARACCFCAVALLCVLGTVRASAQSLPLRLSEYQKQQWQVEDGLPSNNIRMIAQEPDGMLLLATSAGLASFDGLRFQSTGDTLGGEAANAILFDPSGTLWVGTDGRGLVRIAKNSSPQYLSEAAGHPGERIRMLRAAPDGAMWIATQNGVEIYRDGHMAILPVGGMISGDLTQVFAEGSSASETLFVTSSGLYVSAAGTNQVIPIPSSAGAATAIYRDHDAQHWLGTTRGVFELAHEAAGWRVGARRFATESPVTTMLDDHYGALWAGTRRSGIYRASGDGTEHWTTAQGLADDGVRTLAFDDEDDLWIGTLTGGLTRWREGTFAAYGREEGFPAGYAGPPFADSHGALWLGTWDKGLFRKQGETLTAMPLPGNPRESPIRAITEASDGDIWIGTWFHGVYRYDGHRFKGYLLGTESPGNAVSTLLADRSGGLWVGTYNGLLPYPSGTPIAGTQPLLSGHLISTLALDGDGSVLAGTRSGLFRIRDSGRSITAIRHLSNPYVLSLFRDPLGTMWVSTMAGGLQQVDGTNAISAPHGSIGALPQIHSAVADADGHLLFGTSRGILRVPVFSLHQLFAGLQPSLSMLLLDKSDGLRSSESSGLSRPLSTRTADGTLWFSTTGGFVHTTPLAKYAGAYLPAACIRGWALSNNADVAELTRGAKAILKPGEPDLLLFFWAKRLSDAARVEFRYRLVGYDRAWTVTRARVARYRWLPPGRYRFEVQARVSDGDWTSALASLTIIQEPHFYQTWLFAGTCLLLAIAALTFLIRLRIRMRIQRVKGSMGMVLEERNRIAQECHDTLMAGFAAISWQLEATAKLFRDSGDEATPAARSSELARSMVMLCQAEARRIIWDLRDSDEVTDSLSRALSRMLERNHIREQVDVRLSVLGEELALAPGCVHHLTRIVQEGTSNAVRHGGADLVEITLLYTADSLELRVLDNGCGFAVHEQQAAKLGHFGMAVMEERTRKLGGTLRFESDSDGTEVFVTVPFHTMARTARAETKEEVVPWIGL